MDIFKNANLKVEPYNYTIGKETALNIASESSMANAKLREMNAAQKNAIVQESIDSVEFEIQKKENIERVVMNSLAEAQLPNVMNSISVTGKDILFKDILFEVFEKSLLLDEDFVCEQYENLRALTDNFIDENGGFKLLESSIERTGSNLLKRIKTICESTANKVCKRKLKEFNECNDRDCLNFDINSEERDELNFDKGEIDIDKISSMVKDKVLTVIRDEKEREEEEKKIVTEIEDDLIENGEVTDEKSLNEALEKIVIGKSKVQEATLFNALLKSSYKEILKENVAITSADKNKVDKDDDFSASYDTEANLDDIKNDSLEPDYNVEDDEVNDNLVLEGASIDMDLVMAEAITKYTLMETLHTLKLKDYSYNEIAKMTHKMVN